MASSSTTTSFLLCLLLPLLSHATTFTVLNNCSYTVWAAAIPGGSQKLNPKLNPGKSWTFNNEHSYTGRIWGRTDCNFDANGNGLCDTGDCRGRLQCTEDGSSPVTLAKYVLHHIGDQEIQDYCKISLVEGFNIPIEFVPTSGGCHKDDTSNLICPHGTKYTVTFCP